MPPFDEILILPLRKSAAPSVPETTSHFPSGEKAMAPTTRSLIKMSFFSLISAPEIYENDEARNRSETTEEKSEGT